MIQTTILVMIIVGLTIMFIAWMWSDQKGLLNTILRRTLFIEAVALLGLATYLTLFYK